MNVLFWCGYILLPYQIHNFDKWTPTIIYYQFETQKNLSINACDLAARAMKKKYPKCSMKNVLIL